MKHISHSLDETIAIATRLARLVQPGDVITLQGELGVGKTAFARGFIASFFDPVPEIASPSFNIVHIYDAPDFPIWHIDLYRIEDESETRELGLEEGFNQGVSLIEWPERMAHSLPKDRLLITLFYDKDDNTRRIELTPYGTWEKRLCEIS